MNSAIKQPDRLWERVVSLSVVIPAYNEAGRLPKAVKEIAEFLRNRGVKFETIVVDDGSGDDTARVTAELQRTFSEVRLIQFPHNRGKGAAVRSGILESTGDFVLFTDADQSTSIDQLERLLAPLIEADFDIAIGSRAVLGAKLLRRQHWFRERLGKSFSILLRALLMRGHGDTQCGFKCFTRAAAIKIFPHVTSDTALFDMEVLLIAMRHHLRVAEVGVTWTHDPDSRIVYDLRRSLATFVELLRIRRAWRVTVPERLPIVVWDAAGVAAKGGNTGPGTSRVGANTRAESRGSHTPAMKSPPAYSANTSSRVVSAEVRGPETIADSYTERTRAWLNGRFSRKPGQPYISHKPLYGYERHQNLTEPSHLSRYGLTFQILRLLNRMDFATCLDLGSAEGYTASLVKNVLGRDAYVADLSIEAVFRARELFSLDGVALNAANLPFADNSFDVVICSEALEHLEHPFVALREAARIAGKYLLITTTESRCTQLERRLALRYRRLDLPHPHRSIWIPEDFERLFGNDVLTFSQFIWDRFPNCSVPNETEAKRILTEAVTLTPPSIESVGIVVVKCFGTNTLSTDSILTEPELMDRIFESRLSPDCFQGTAEPRQCLRTDLLARLRCTQCRSRLEVEGDRLGCSNCTKGFQVVSGVPDMVALRPADLNTSRPECREYVQNLTHMFDSQNTVRGPRKRMLQLLELLAYGFAERDFRGVVHIVWAKIRRRIRAVKGCELQTGVEA